MTPNAVLQPSRNEPQPAQIHVLVKIGMCLGLVTTAAIAHAQTAPLGYRVLSWQPVTSTVSLRETQQSTPVPIKLALTVKAPDLLCLTSDQPVQTLVQVQPSEGGEARHVVLGGSKPVCAPVGDSWSSAATREVPWFKTLFNILGEHPTGSRVSARTAGSTRGTDQTQTTRVDPCDLFPTTAEGVVQLPAGSATLALATGLPTGTSLFLSKQGVNTPPISAQATARLVQWPVTAFGAGERWRVSYQKPLDADGPTATEECSTDIVIQPQSSDPLKAAREYSPRFATDEATAHAVLVAALLDDKSLVAWHAWLLSTLSPELLPADSIGGTLWRTWWSTHGAGLSPSR